MNTEPGRRAGDSNTPTGRTGGLTARGVKMRLTRAKVDFSTLTITEEVVTCRRVDVDFSGPWRERNTVIVAGPKDERRDAWWALFNSGLSCAPYPDRDEWTR
jgi:hypothetical protein